MKRFSKQVCQQINSISDLFNQLWIAKLINMLNQYRYMQISTIYINIQLSNWQIQS